MNTHGGFDWSKELADRFYYPSPATHQEHWKSFKKSACFQFVRFWGRSADWLIDPSTDDFLARLSKIAEDRRLVQDFFGKVLWTQDKLRDRIDLRSMSDDDYFSFPSSLKPVRVQVPSFPASGYDALKGYRRNRSEDYVRQTKKLSR